MPTSYTTLLGLAKPATGELTGTWGATVNSYITEYLDAAVAGAQVISGSQTAVTLSTTNGSSLVQAGASASGSSQYAIIRCTGNPAGLLTITAPATSKVYLVINNTSTNQSVKIVGAGPTTGVTIAAGIAALVAWNGTDFALIASTDVVKLSTLGTGVATALGLTVTGSGGIVLATSPTLTTPTLTSPTVNTLLTVNGDSSLDGAVTVNESGADKDFRVESDTNPNMLFVDASTNTVGIGTATPAYTLDINAGSGNFRVRDATGGNDVAIRTAAGPVSLIGSVANTPIAFTTNNTERVRITAAGNVGIGTSSPILQLEVNGATNCTVSSAASSGYGAFQAVGSGTNPAYVFFANVTNGERARLTATNAGDLVIGTGVSATDRVIVTSGGLLQFNSGYGSVATAYGCRAWINFNGTSGSIGTGRGSGNVSSVTDHGPGDYTINFSTAMPDANYAVVGMAMGNTGSTEVIVTTPDIVSWAAGAVRIGVRGGSGTLADAPYVNVAVFR